MAVACSEETDLHSDGVHYERLAVEALITDRADRQQRKLFLTLMRTLLAECLELS